jgi:hypothetical protein
VRPLARLKGWSHEIEVLMPVGAPRIVRLGEIEALTRKMQFNTLVSAPIASELHKVTGRGQANNSLLLVLVILDSSRWRVSRQTNPQWLSVLVAIPSGSHGPSKSGTALPTSS